jgi:transcriptional regulator with XRE-family HTH domain
MKSKKDNIEKKEKAELDHEVELLMKKFLYEVYKQIRVKKLNKTDLAVLLRVSPGYLSQLFHGQKPLTFSMLARLQQVLHIEFEITARSHN